MKLKLYFIFILLLLSSLAHAQSVTWSNSRTGQNGGAAGYATWTASNIPLYPGINPITICATNSNGQTCTSQTVVYAPTFPGSALVGAWAFDELAGTTATDSSLAGNPGTFFNGATRTIGLFPPSLLLDGNNDYVSVANSNSINFAQGFTYAAWVYTPNTYTDFRTIFERNIDGEGSVQGLFASVAGYCGNGAVMATMTVNGNAGPTYNLCDANPLQLSTWTFLAMTYDGSIFKLYRQGVLDQSAIASGYMGVPQVGAQYNALTIGAHPSGVQNFGGMIDEARIANYAIPLTIGSKNVTPGAACDYSDVDINGQLVLSIVSAMNCRIIAPVAPVVFKLPAAASAMSIAPGAIFSIGQP